MPERLQLPDLTLENGDLLASPVIAYRTWGQLNAACDNAVIVCHSLTSNTDVTAWWPSLIGPGAPLDTDHFFVVCMNALGSPYGSTSPLSIHPERGERYGSRFPDITVRDTVRAHRQVLDHLGVSRVEAAVGASLGAMQVLEWSFFSDFVRRLVAIAVGGRHSAWGISWTAAQRAAIYADPHWCGGDYYGGKAPMAGLAAARMMAMISYRSASELSERFGRSRSDATARFDVESWLLRHGEKLIHRFDAGCYVALTKQMNTHDIARNRGSFGNVLASIRQSTLIIGVSSDVLYPICEQEELAAGIPNAELLVLETGQGHDSFLIHTDRIAQMIGDFMTGDKITGDNTTGDCLTNGLVECESI